MIQIFAPITYQNEAGTIRTWTIRNRLEDRTLTVTPGNIFSIERPWLDNTPNVSRIPNGIYTLVPWVSPKFGAVWSVIGGSVSPHRQDVGGGHAERWGCLVHPGNYPKDLQGCFALGDTTREGEEPAVWNSRDTIAKFRLVMHCEPFAQLYLS
jgi:hypothetical protein